LDEKPSESLSLSYGSIKFVYSQQADVAASCTGSAPPVTSTLLGVLHRGSTILARVDCLTAHCRGDLTVSLPGAACPAADAPCAFTGGVRVGLNGGGKVHFNGDGSATLADGSKVGVSGAGKFSMGDGSVRIVRLSVPAPLQKWLNGHKHGTLGSIIVVRGL